MDIGQVLTQYGPLGIVAAWLMFRVETRLERMERALHQYTRAHLLDVLSRPDISEPVKIEAERAMVELNGGRK